MNLEIRNGTIITPRRPPREGLLRVHEGRISPDGEEIGGSFQGDVLDAQGGWILPGFIDLHTHGAAGASAMEGSEEALRAFAEAKLREGVTTFLPTTWTAPLEDLVRAARGVAAYRERMDFARTPGLHVEGPFLNPDCLGAQNPAHARLPDLGEIDRLARETPVSLVSLAVELEGGMNMVRGLAQRGIRSSLAHTAATYEQFLEARKAGLNHLTHFCNQMTPLHHRAVGIVGAGLLDDEIPLELIADGIHLCPEMIRLVFRCVGADRVLLITDSISASGMPDGRYEEGGQPVVVEDGICRLESGALAGSTLRFAEALRQVAVATEQPVAAFVQSTGWNQASSLGWEDVGRIEPGCRGDLVVLDPSDFSVRATVVGGEVRWRAG